MVTTSVPMLLCCCLPRQQAPGVPYTGGYLEHIWAIENVQKTYTPEGLVNFSKMTAVSYCNTMLVFKFFTHYIHA